MVSAVTVSRVFSTRPSSTSAQGPLPRTAVSDKCRWSTNLPDRARPCRRGRSGGFVGRGFVGQGVEVEGEVATGQLADGDGAARVQGLGAAEGGQSVRADADGVVEVEGVGQVELSEDLAGAGEGDGLVVDVEPAPVRGVASLPFGLLGHEPGDRLLDQPVHLGRRDLVGDRGDVPVHEPGRLTAQPDGLVGDPPGPPGRQVTGGDPRPEPGQPVTQLDGLPDVPFPGLGRQPDRGRELRDRELRHQRRPRPGHRDRGVTEPGQPHRLRLVDRLGRVHHRPGHGQLQQLRFGTVGLGTPDPRGRQHPGRRVRQRIGARGAHDPHPSSDHRHRSPRNRLRTPVSTGDSTS